MKIQFDKAKYQETFFPLITLDEVWNKDLYQKLKNSFPKFSQYRTITIGQKGRRNIRVNPHNLKILKQQAPEFANLFQYIKSRSFKEALLKHFPPKLLKKYGFKGSLKNTKVLMDICEAKDGYENPFHVDTRGRIIHGLIYFGKDTIQSGGELCIAKHKSLKTWRNYKQSLNLNNIERVKAFPPNDNFGVFVLSTPNSYHKGNHTIGLRRFIYISIDNSRIPAWECGWLNDKRSLDIRLREQKESNKNVYDQIQQNLSKHNYDFII